MKFGWAAAVVGLVACGGAVDPQSLTDDKSASQAGDVGRGAPAKPDVPRGIPRSSTGPSGIAGNTRCAPLDQTSTVPATLSSSPVIAGQAWNSMPYIIDADPERPGAYRAFIGHRYVFERHHVTVDETTPGRFIIDRGLPNQILITSTTIEGAGEDGPLSALASDLMGVYSSAANESLGSLAYAPATNDLWTTTALWVVAPIRDGAISVPRVFYGPPENIKERTFLGFGPADSYESATPASSITFDLDGTPTTMPTVVARQTAGLINGFGSSAMNFLCF